MCAAQVPRERTPLSRRGEGLVFNHREPVGGSLALCWASEKTPHPPFGHPLPAAAGRGGRKRRRPDVYSSKASWRVTRPLLGLGEDPFYDPLKSSVAFRIFFSGPVRSP
jgi:hypothetical protein